MRVSSAIVAAWLIGAASPAVAATYEYDGSGRLERALYSDGTIVTYSYDANGNRLNAVVTPPPDQTPPSVPLNLTTSVVSFTRIDLDWSPSTDNVGVVGYKLERCEGAACSNFTEIATPSASDFSNTGLSGSTTYRYRVRAYDGANLHSGYSSIASGTTSATPDITPPSVPTNLAASAPAHNRVNLTWSASTDTGGSGLAGYRVYRGGVEIGTSGSAGYTDNTVVGSTAYSYRVASYDNATPANVSAQSSAAGVTTPAPPDTTAPSVPTGLTGSAVSSTQVNLSWNASTDTGGSGLAGYRVYRGGVQIGTSGTSSYSDTTTAGSTAYSYAVAAYDNATPANVSALSSAFGLTTPDTMAPTVPTGLAASVISATRVDLTWNASTDTGGSGLAGYRVYRNGSQIGTSPSASYSDTTAAGNTTYSYTVASYDNAAPANVSAQSSAAGATTPVAIPAPPAGVFGPIENTSGNYTITWSSSTGATRYELWESRFGAPYQKRYDGPLTAAALSGKTSGEYTYAAKACNVAGCSNYSPTHMVRVCKPQCL